MPITDFYLILALGFQDLS